MRILDIGCGLGDMYPFLKDRFGAIEYTGVDIVPGLVEAAQTRRPDARFICQNILENPLTERFDFVLISGIFNNAEIPSSSFFIRQMLSAAYAVCNKALAFNFISSHVNFRDPKMAYFDPVGIFGYCLDNLGKKIVLNHHYEKCDVAVFVYR
jgi:SAM-dependent methyltransferase